MWCLCRCHCIGQLKFLENLFEWHVVLIVHSLSKHRQDNIMHFQGWLEALFGKEINFSDGFATSNSSQDKGFGWPIGLCTEKIPAPEILNSVHDQALQLCMCLIASSSLRNLLECSIITLRPQEYSSALLNNKHYALSYGALCCHVYH